MKCAKPYKYKSLPFKSFVSLSSAPQLYVLKVLCKDGSSYFIRRRYRQFDEMENALEKRFPIEAGAIKVTDRTLPKLPSKKSF